LRVSFSLKNPINFSKKGRVSQMGDRPVLIYTLSVKSTQGRTMTTTTPPNLVDKAFAQRKQAQLDAQASLEKTLNQCLRDARRAAVRMRKRSFNASEE
jgi:hypothetical protein